MSLLLTVLIIYSLFSFVFLLPASAYTQGYDGMGPVVIDGGRRDFKWPVPGYNNIQSCFYDTRNHCAIDISAPVNTSAVASYAGTVIKAVDGGTNYYGDGFGNYVVLQHTYQSSNGAITLYSRYSHLNSVSVREGAVVSVGAEIGKIGTTGSSTGYHLDFQILYGNWQPYQTYSIDPYANQLLELPSNIVVYDSWACGTSYLALVKELYSQPLVSEPTSIIYPADGGIYKIASGVGNNMYLDFACTNDNVQIYENCDNHSDPAFVISQYYKITHVGDGWHSIINIGNGKAMDVDGGNSASGTNIHQWAYDGNNAQLFRFYDAGDGYCYIKSKLGCYVDVQNGDSVNNTNVWTYSFNGSNAQKWNLIKHLHYYTAEITTPATCSSNGIRTYTCRQCKHSHDETIYATDHSYSSSITKQPTCTKEGVRTFTCSACGHSYTEAIAKKAHSWNAATCTAPKTCASCGTTEGSALGHNFVNEIITEATCTTVGVEQKTCTRCGELEIYYIEAPGHKYSSVVTPPTCTEYGYTTYTCLNCGDSYTWEREFPAHTIVNGSCSVCGESTVYSSGTCGKNLTWILDFQGTLTISGEGDMLDFRGMGSIPPWEMNSNLIKAIIVEDGITSIGEKAFFSFYPELSSITMADSVTDIGASAFYGNKALDKVVLGKNVKSVGDYAFFSCTALTSVTISNSIANIGESVFSGCSSLTDVYYSGTEEEWDNIAFGNDNEELLNANIHYNCHITPDDHDYVAVVTAPTCTEQGFTTYSCICGSAYITDMVREKGHDYKEVIIYPTCTTDGNVNYVCNACGERLPGNKMPALGHKYFDTVTTVPTCIEVGSRTYTCSRCDSNYSETIPFVGHTLGAAATCTTDQVCTVCGEVLTEKLGHDYNAVVTAPTCTEDGYTTYTCLVCGNGYSGDFVDAEGHSYSSEITTAATCTADGVKTFTCSKCNHSYTEAIAKTDHKWTAATCTAPKTCSVCKTSEGTALGHNYTSKVTKAATCTAAGVKTFTCSKCSNSYTESIPATGHTWTAATCTTAKTCSVCKATDGAALGHSYTAKVTKAATCTAAGIKTFICENDANHTYTENIPALGHTEEIIPAIAATCTETGLTEGKKCSVCGEVLVAQAVIDKTSHKPTMVGEKAATATQDGYTGDTVCTTCGMMIEEGKVIPATGDSSGSGRCDHLCHKDGILGFFWKILRLFFKLFQINPVCECGAAHY